jgi:putative transposase
MLHEPEYVDLCPAQVVAKLLDAGRYECSERTMYRLLASRGEVRERRAQLTHPHYEKPQLMASGPN